MKKFRIFLLVMTGAAVLMLINKPKHYQEGFLIPLYGY